MSFSKLARVGFDYKGTGKTPKSISSKSSNKSDKNAKSEIYYASENTSKIDDKENTIRDVTNGIMNDKANTVIEEFDESFSEWTSDIDDEPVTRQTVERYTNHTMRNPNSECSYSYLKSFDKAFIYYIVILIKQLIL